MRCFKKVWFPAWINSCTVIFLVSAVSDKCYQSDYNCFRLFHIPSTWLLDFWLFPELNWNSTYFGSKEVLRNAIVLVNHLVILLRIICLNQFANYFFTSRIVQILNFQNVKYPLAYEKKTVSKRQEQQQYDFIFTHLSPTCSQIS